MLFASSFCCSSTFYAFVNPPPQPNRWQPMLRDGHRLGSRPLPLLQDRNFDLELIRRS